MRHLRSIMRITWMEKVSPVLREILERTGLPTMEDLLIRKNLQWTGHLMRMSADKWQITVIITKPNHVTWCAQPCFGWSLINELCNVYCFQAIYMLWYIWCVILQSFVTNHINSFLYNMKKIVFPKLSAYFNWKKTPTNEIAYLCFYRNTLAHPVPLYHGLA